MQLELAWLGNREKDALEGTAARLIALLRSGERNWRQPWVRLLHRGANGRPYREGTQNLLNMLRFNSCDWYSEAMLARYGAQPLPGQRPTLLWGVFNAATTEQPGERLWIRTSLVYNRDQVTGGRLPQRRKPYHPRQASSGFDELVLLEFVGRSGARIGYGGDSAYYRSDTDEIQVPERSRFMTDQDFWATVLHELAHWTGHHSRCDRDRARAWGDYVDAIEELVAEFTAAQWCARFGVSGLVGSHGSYLRSWAGGLSRPHQGVDRDGDVDSAYLQHWADELEREPPDWVLKVVRQSTHAVAWLDKHLRRLDAPPPP